MKIKSENTSGLLLIHVEGRLDAITSPEFEREAMPMIKQTADPVLIDFVKLDYISSAGLQTLLIIAKEMKKADNTLALCCLNETVTEIFSISGFQTIFSIYPTIEDGIKLLK